ncbi:DUF1403 family protein [Paenirhodobacter sp.]|uniref:DUF1403 family protein n=1 Tax=Paenirhodobacter sp. TaxID=1965326 RepID=UPI003B3E638C
MPEHLPPSPVAPPRWIRQGVARDDAETALFAAGAALAVLDPAARSEHPAGMVWRRRLALMAAVATSALDGRRAGEAQLRDHWALRRPGDDPGPDGRMLEGWRLLGLRPADWPSRLPGCFDLPPEPVADLLRGLGARLAGRALPLRTAAEAANEIRALGPPCRGLALWVGDAVLARALGWARPVPLIAAHLPRAAFRLTGEDWLTACAGAWARGAVAAFDLHGDLVRRAEALRLAAPKLRGKDAQAAVAALMAEDAIPAQAGARTSDRAARRLFERLTGLGLVRELTGRATFRLYGL